MATKGAGPKVQKVDKAKSEKEAAKAAKAEEKAAKAAEKEAAKAAKAAEKEAANAAKAEEKAAKAAEKEAAKAARAEAKAAKKSVKGGKAKSQEAPDGDQGEQPAKGDKSEKARKKEAAKAEKAAKKQAKGEKTKAKKISREDGEKKPAGKKKTLIMAGVALVLVLLIACSVFFLVRMLRGGRGGTASLPEQPSSSETPISVGGAAGEASEAPAGESGAPEASEAQPSGDGKESGESGKDEKDRKDQTDGKDSEKAQSGDGKKQESSSAPQSGDAQPAADPVEQALEGTVGTANVAAMLGSGAVPPDQVDITRDTPTDQPKPGQIRVGKETESASSAPEAPSKPPKDEGPGGTALTPPDKTQAVPDFKFSDASLNLPAFAYAASNATEAAVHRDIGAYLAQKDERPGVQITSVVICGRVNQPDGSVRVLAYAWGSRYAIAENTLFDYGSLVGPCALDYQGGALQKITLARPGDLFESSVREFCGERQDVADKMVNQAYDLELRGQMLRNVSTYIQQNSIPVDFFRASGQVYNRDGSIYLPPELQQEESAAESEAEAAVDGAESPEGGSSDGLRDSYKVIQDMPE